MKPPNFKINLSVRISDINYGNHLGHAELIKLTHQARLKFFAQDGLKELNPDGSGLMVKHLSVDYINEAFFDDTLIFLITISSIGKASCVFTYNIMKQDQIPVALVEETVVFINYHTRKPIRVPEAIFLLQRHTTNPI